MPSGLAGVVRGDGGGDSPQPTIRQNVSHHSPQLCSACLFGGKVVTPLLLPMIEFPLAQISCPVGIFAHRELELPGLIGLIADTAEFKHAEFGNARTELDRNIGFVHVFLGRQSGFH